jgi:hypothetical protein
VNKEGQLLQCKHSIDGVHWKAFPKKNEIMISPSSALDMIINDMNNLAAHAYQYFIRPVSMAGGGGKYFFYTIPSKLASNKNVIYSAIVKSEYEVEFLATSTNGSGTVTAALDIDGQLRHWNYTGEFNSIKNKRQY